MALYCPVRKAYCVETPYYRPGCPLADRCALLLTVELHVPGEVGERAQRKLDAFPNLDLSALILHEQAN